MLTEKYDFRITDQMTIPLRPHWIANDSYREKCKMLVLNRSKGEIHKVDFSKLTDYIKEGDVICFNDSTIINHMFICKTRQNRLCCFQVFKSKPHLFLKIRLRRSVCVTAYLA